MILRIALTALLAVTLASAQGRKGGGGGRGGGGGEDGGFGGMRATNRLDSISEMLKLTKDQKKDFKTTMLYIDVAEMEITDVVELASQQRTVRAAPAVEREKVRRKR